jgi:phage terminase large subunit-like protein
VTLLDEKLALLREAEERRKYNHWRYIKPVPKQMEYLSSMTFETMFSAGNGNGKTEMAGYKVSRFLTGEYPNWWQGRRFARPVHGWVVSKTASLGLIPQEKLLGVKDINMSDKFGTGMIPRDAIIEKPSASRSVQGGASTVRIKSKYGESLLEFKSADQGREALQGDTLDFVWFDEESPLEVYTESVTRALRKEDSCVDVTFTPLLGETELFLRFYRPTPEWAKHVTFVNMTLDDCTWYSKELREKTLAGWPQRERRARRLGLPTQGMGLVWTVDEETIRMPTIRRGIMPGRWRFIWGVDFGIAHPFAACLCAYDPENDLFIVMRVIKMVGETPVVHAAEMKKYGAMVPVAWPHDGAKRDPGSGRPLRDLYAAEGLHMLADHAQDIEGSNSLYGSTEAMGVALQTGRFRVFDCCDQFFEEYRSYHYGKDGKIVDERDDVVSAARYAYMMRRYAKPVALGDRMVRPTPQTVEAFDLFTGQPFGAEYKQPDIISTEIDMHPALTSRR